METVDDSIKCPICKKIFNFPVILPCGKSICIEHVIKKTEIFCQVCDEDHLVPSGGFISNKKLEQMIASKVYKLNFDPEYVNATNNCKKLDEMLDEIDLLNQDPCNYIFEVIGELKRDVNLKREEFKAQIDIDADVAIKQLSEYEAECNRNVKSFTYLAKSNDLAKKTKAIRTKLKTHVNHLKIFEVLKEELETFIDDLKSRTIIFKKETLLNRNEIVLAEKSKEFIQICNRNFMSKIVVDRHLIESLYTICEFNPDQEWKLLYRASEHGFQASDFHTKCDYKPNTLTIIKSSNGNIFGGYTEATWDNAACSYKSDQNAFLFSLINLYNKPTKLKIIQNYDYYDCAITCDPTYGPSFGDPDELVLCYQRNNYNYLSSSASSLSLKNGYSNLAGFYVILPSYPRGANGTNFLAGSSEFEVIDVEVFMKN